jgi:hypothetical protein
MGVFGWHDKRSSAEKEALQHACTYLYGASQLISYGIALDDNIEVVAEQFPHFGRDNLEKARESLLKHAEASLRSARLYLECHPDLADFEPNWTPEDTGLIVEFLQCEYGDEQPELSDAMRGDLLAPVYVFLERCVNERRKSSSAPAADIEDADRTCDGEAKEQPSCRD